MTAANFISDLKKSASRSNEDVAFMARFFKTGKGQYGEGDRFVGATVPEVRRVCKTYKDLSLAEIEKLLESPIHEARLGAVIVMAEQAKRAKKDEAQKKALYDLYLRRTDRINNWDIVDSSAPQVVGAYLQDKPRDTLYKLAGSESLWERRISIISTLHFVRSGELAETFKIAKLLLGDKQDLIHKAVGWALREAGKKDRHSLLEFLDQHALAMPRTALRYAIEHLSPEQKQHYMSLK